MFKGSATVCERRSLQDLSSSGYRGQSKSVASAEIIPTLSEDYLCTVKDPRCSHHYPVEYLKEIIAQNQDSQDQGSSLPCTQSPTPILNSTFTEEFLSSKEFQSADGLLDTTTMNKNKQGTSAARFGGIAAGVVRAAVEVSKKNPLPTAIPLGKAKGNHDGATLRPRFKGISRQRFLPITTSKLKPREDKELGHFPSAEQAARAHDVAILKLHKRDEVDPSELNYPAQDYEGDEMQSVRDLSPSQFLLMLNQYSSVRSIKVSGKAAVANGRPSASAAPNGNNSTSALLEAVSSYAACIKYTGLSKVTNDSRIHQDANARDKEKEEDIFFKSRICIHKLIAQAWK
eukprot:scaffold421687_cov51-Prasinocladus_malaysianus.AAC.4